MSKIWEKVAENLVRHLPSGGMYLRAKVGGKIIKRSLRTKAVKVGKMKRDDLLKELREEVGIDGKGFADSLKLKAAIELTLESYAALPKYQKTPANLAYRQQVAVVLGRSLPGDPKK